MSGPEPGCHCLSKSLGPKMRVAVQFVNWDFFFFNDERPEFFQNSNPGIHLQFFHAIITPLLYRSSLLLSVLL